jgi:hypothetical protein
MAAWTVAKQANGDIDVTINQLKDPAGLQATLRADGLPVTVSFSGPMLNASCQPYAASRNALRAVAQFHSDYLAIDPSALPTSQHCPPASSAPGSRAAGQLPPPG